MDAPRLFVPIVHRASESINLSRRCHPTFASHSCPYASAVVASTPHARTQHDNGWCPPQPSRRVPIRATSHSKTAGGRHQPHCCWRGVCVLGKGRLRADDGGLDHPKAKFRFEGTARECFGRGLYDNQDHGEGRRDEAAADTGQRLWHTRE